MKRIFYLLLLPAFAFIAPGNKPAKIKGHIKLAQPVEWIYFLYPVRGDERVIDSAKVINGGFSYDASFFSEVSLAELYVYPGNDKTKREMTTLFLEQGSISITIEGSLKTMKVEGSKAHSEYLMLKERLKPFEERQAELRRKLRELDKAGDKDGMKIIQAEKEALWQEIREKVYASWLLEHPKSAIAGFVMESHVGSWYSTNIEQLEQSQALFKRLPEATRQRPSVKEFEKRLNAAMKSSAGRLAMDFTLNDTAGRAVTLSSFRGKYVYIDFWASWCKPCRADNPNLVKAYHQFKDKNIVILGIAFDGTNYKAWKNAIQTDKLPYLNVIDTIYPGASSVGKRYNIGSVPQNVLVDPSGKIIAKNIESKNLIEKLSTVLGHANID